MNNSEVIAAIVKATAQPEDICEKVVRAFEEISGSGIMGTLIGKSINLDKIAEIASKSGVPESVCRSILQALEGVLKQEIKGKFSFFK